MRFYFLLVFVVSILKSTIKAYSRPFDTQKTRWFWTCYWRVIWSSTQTRIGFSAPRYPHHEAHSTLISMFGVFGFGFGFFGIWILLLLMIIFNEKYLQWKELIFFQVVLQGALCFSIKALTFLYIHSAKPLR